MSKNILDFNSDNIFLQDKERKISFKEMSALTQSLGQSFDLPRGASVLVDIRDPFYFFATILYCFANGIRPALLNWYFSESQITDLIKANSYAALITDQNVHLNIPVVKVDSTQSFALSQKNAPLEISTESEIIFFSSGSVKTKACLLTLRQFVYSARGSNDNIPFSSNDTWALCLPHFHVGGFSIFIRALVAKGSVIWIKDLNDLKSIKPSHISLVSTQFIRALESDIDLSKLRHILLGGSAIPEAYLKIGISKGYSLHKSYGMTELATQISTTAILHNESNLQSSGRVLPYLELKIANGKIYVRGDCLFKGYLENDEPILSLEDGWFDTRDLGYLSENQVFVTGRSDRVFQCGGENISPETIEQELLKIGGVLKAYVVPTEDKEYGLRPIAYVDHSPKKKLSDIQTDLESRLKGFHRPVAYFPWAESPKKTWK